MNWKCFFGHDWENYTLRLSERFPERRCCLRCGKIQGGNVGNFGSYWVDMNILELQVKREKERKQRLEEILKMKL